jgi:putative ABC transport system ATP-binding protein
MMSITVSKLQIAIGESTLFTAHPMKFDSGKIYCVRGRSGSGKTSLLHTLAGVKTNNIDENNINYFLSSSQSVNNNVKPILGKDLILLQQSYPLWPHLTSLQNVWIPWSSFQGSQQIFKRRQKAIKLSKYWLESLEINPSIWKRKPIFCSGGEKQRIAFASKLVFDCSILLLDEPNSSLDRASTNLVIDILESQANQGKLVIIVSHDWDLISRSCWNHLEIVDSENQDNGKILCEVSK